jgi:hypothetical protein
LGIKIQRWDSNFTGEQDDQNGGPHGYVLGLKDVTVADCALAAFEFTTLHMIEVIPHNRNPANLTPYMKSKHLLLSPYLEGSRFEKISGDTGEISADWRDKGGKLQRITRTLDAFQHYVVAKSGERLLIADLQGKISTQFAAKHVLI